MKVGGRREGGTAAARCSGTSLRRESEAGGTLLAKETQKERASEGKSGKATHGARPGSSQGPPPRTVRARELGLAITRGGPQAWADRRMQTLALQDNNKDYCTVCGNGDAHTARPQEDVGTCMLRSISSSTR